MRHPDDEEAESLISMFASQPCRFGVDCKQTGCLYFHPEPTCFSADPVNAVEWTPANGLYGNASNNRKQDPTLIPQQWPKMVQDGVLEGLGAIWGASWPQDGAKRVPRSKNSIRSPHVGAQVGTPFFTFSSPGWFTRGLETQLDYMLCPDTNF